MRECKQRRTLPKQWYQFVILHQTLIQEPTEEINNSWVKQQDLIAVGQRIQMHFEVGDYLSSPHAWGAVQWAIGGSRRRTIIINEWHGQSLGGGINPKGEGAQICLGCVWRIQVVVTCNSVVVQCASNPILPAMGQGRVQMAEGQYPAGRDRHARGWGMACARPRLRGQQQTPGPRKKDCHRRCRCCHPTAVGGGSSVIVFNNNYIGPLRSQWSRSCREKGTIERWQRWWWWIVMVCVVDCVCFLVCGESTKK